MEEVFELATAVIVVVFAAALAVGFSSKTDRQKA